MGQTNNHTNPAGPAGNMGPQGAAHAMSGANTSGATKPINTIDYFDNSTGKPYEQFGNPNYGVPDKPGYAYIPSQATESNVVTPLNGRGTTRSGRAIMTVFALILLVYIVSICFSIWNNRSVRIVDSEYVDAYVMVKEIPLTMQYSPDETRAMIKTGLVDDMNSVMDEVQSDVDEIGGLDVFSEDAEAKRLYDAMYDEIEPMREEYLQDATDVINKLQQTADSLPSDQAVNYWLQTPTVDEQNYIQEKTVMSDASSGFWSAKSRLQSYLQRKMRE